MDVTRFTADLFGSLARHTDGNLVCSPYSVAVALAMLAQGARGDTAAEILAALHADDPHDADEPAAVVQHLDTALAERTAELSSASSLWGQAGLRWDPAFLHRLETHFIAGLREVDYRQPEPARAAINAWASERTRERIPEILAPGTLSPESRLTLVNAIYFKAAWRTQFQEHATQPADFHLLDGSTVTTPMMSAENGDGHAVGPGWTAVDIPYADAQIALAVVVPEDWAEFERALTGGRLRELLTSFERGRVAVRMPRWTTRSRVDELARHLAGLGVRTAFTSAADFTGMTTQEPLTVSGAVHEGFVAVDEAGTEAAAVTALAMRATSAPLPPPHTVVADRPFLYVVHDRPTHTPLFVGRLLTPET